MFRFRSIFCVLVFGLLLGTFRPAVAATLTVTSLADSGAGSLRDTLAAANNGDTLVFVPGLTGTINLSSTLDITVSVTISGPGADVLTVSGNNSATEVFSLTGGGIPLTLSGLTLTGATASGIFSQSDLDIMNCNIVANGGRGINLESAELNLVSSQVSENQGGGIFAEIGSVVNITDSTLSGNTAGSSGGGLNLQDSTGTLSGATISGNEADDEGGGIYLNSGSTLDLTNVTLSGNTVQVQDATAYRGGGGIKNDGGTLNLLNVTLADNQVAGIQNMTQGGGGLLDDSGNSVLQNTLLAQNSIPAPGTGVDCFANLISNGFNLIGIGGSGTGCSGVTDGVNGDQVGSTGNPLDPQIAELGDFGGTVATQTLLEGSPAVDAGTNSGCPTEDSRGTSRPLDGLGVGGNAICDVGAVEAGRVNLVLQSGSALGNLKFQGLDPNAPIDFSATLTNEGPDYAPGVSLSATMPDGVTLLAAGAGNQDCFLSSTQLQCDLGSLASGAALPVALTLQLANDSVATYRIPVTAMTTGENQGSDNTVTFLVSVGEPSQGGGGGCSCDLEASRQSIWGGLALAGFLGLTWLILRFYRRNSFL